MHLGMRVMLATVLCWYPASIVHEIGHWLSARCFGRCDPCMVWHYGIFSETVRDGSATPHLDAWMGPLAGVALPMLVFAVLRRRRGAGLAGWFAAMSLIGNGLYIGLGWLDVAGDPVDMVRLGTPVWVLCVFGVMCLAVVPMYLGLDAQREPVRHGQ